MNANHLFHQVMSHMHITFTQLQCLVALADSGSFTEAAEAVGLTQSAVSHALAALEHALGVTLLERNRKGVGALTSIGQAVLPHARALLVHASAIEQEAKAAKGRVTGKLRVGTVRSFSPEVLAGVLGHFRPRYPDIDVLLFEGTMDEVHAWIRSSIVDIGFVLHPAEGLASTLITTDELCVLVPARHWLHAARAVPLGALRAEDLITAKVDCAFRLLELAGLHPGRLAPQIRLHASDSTTIVAMVREGFGVSLFPRMTLPSTLEGVVVLPLDPPQRVPIGLAVKAQAPSSPGVTLFLQTALAWAAAREAGPVPPESARTLVS